MDVAAKDTSRHLFSDEFISTAPPPPPRGPSGGGGGSGYMTPAASGSPTWGKRWPKGLGQVALSSPGGPSGAFGAAGGAGSLGFP